MAVVTVSRQLGSHGARIARLLAKDLGYAFADKTLIDKVVRQYGLTRLDALYDQPPSIWDLFKTDSAITISMLNETMAAIAQRGDAVILGRGGFSLFEGEPGVLNVLVKAPLEIRVSRIARRDDLTTDAATQVVKADDAMRAKFVRLFYGKDWAKDAAYDLVIDTGECSDSKALSIIGSAVAALPPVGPSGELATTSMVDPVLAATVGDLLS